MSGTTFSLDIIALIEVIGISIALYFLVQWRKGFKEPSLFFSHNADWKPLKTLTVFSHLPQKLFWIAFVSFLCAYVDPHLVINNSQKENQNHFQDPTEGIAIYLVLDQSGSMTGQVASVGKSGERIKASKIDIVKLMSKQFILGDSHLGLMGRSNDMIGMVFFARAARVASPLTLDHDAILKTLNTFKTIGNKDQDGTSIGYAIFKTANLIAATRHFNQELIDKGEAAYTIKSSVIILLTDGLQDPNPLDKGKRLRNMDVAEAAQYAKDQQVRLYIINVDPEMSTQKFAPYRSIMTKAAVSTGGKFFMVDDATSLGQIYQAIDGLEKSVLTDQKNKLDKENRPDLFPRISFYPYLIILGLLAFMSAILIDLFFLRKIP